MIMGSRGVRRVSTGTRIREKAGMAVAIFNRFASKETDKQKRGTVRSIPYRQRFSMLEVSGREAKEKYPDDSGTVEDFVWGLKAACKARYKKALEGEMAPMRAEARFHLSKDRMCAYGCLLPPENGGDELTLEDFLEDIHYEGINYGILQEEILQDFGLGYLHIFPVARGKAPKAGEDGKVTELFQRRRNVGLEVQNGSQVDFSEDAYLQPVRKGAAICLIRQPKPGADGTDVTGQALPYPQGVSAWVPQGMNTAVSRDGQALTANVDGLLYIENDRFCIQEQKIIDGGLDQFQGTLRISGNLYIGGNVDGGAEIQASGDIVIGGKLGQARVTSENGIIRVQQGVYGTAGKTFLSAAAQVQARVIERAEIEAGTSVVAETISNSTIRCGGVVYAMTGRGMIVDSLIWAGDSVLCLRIGNLAGGRSRFSVGYPPQIPESWDRIRAELKEVRSTVEKLWGPITSLRKKGSRISDGERSVLEQLVEQRELYMKKQEELVAELKTVNKVLDRKSKGRIRCEKLHPFLDVRIGRLTEEITTIEENCDIHVKDNHIVME